MSRLRLESPLERESLRGSVVRLQGFDRYEAAFIARTTLLCGARLNGPVHQTPLVWRRTSEYVTLQPKLGKAPSFGT